MVPLMSESLERRLSVLERLQLKLHLMVCAWCARYLKQIKLLRQLVRQQTFVAATDTASPVALPAEARQRFSDHWKIWRATRQLRTRQLLTKKSL